MDDLSISGRYTYFWADEAYEDGDAKKRDDEIGHEVDVQAIYDYTEDVQVSLLLAWFIPGDYFDGNTSATTKSDDTAFEAVGTVRVVY